MVYRVLRPGGGLFSWSRIVATASFCHAMADALVLRHAREQAWSAAARATIRMIGVLHRRHVHHGDASSLAAVKDKNLVAPEELEDAALETGFQTAGTFPLDPDRLGGETTVFAVLQASTRHSRPRSPR